MNKEKMIDTLISVLKRLDEYRKITNDLSNKYITDYVKKDYKESEAICDIDGSWVDYDTDLYNCFNPNELKEIIKELKGDNNE